MAGSILVEAGVLASAPSDDVQAAIERLLTLGDVLLLVAPGDGDPVPVVVAATHTEIPMTRWPGVHPEPGLDQRRQGGRHVDPRAATRLAEIQAASGATWLIASEDSVASARGCAGLQIVCIGPAPDEQGPTRPDHRAHSLLEAARWIETSETFA